MSVKSLQLIENAVSWVMAGTRKGDHISPVLSSLRWLPVRSRIELKILLLTYKALNDQAPSCFKELTVKYNPSRLRPSENAGRHVGLLVFPGAEREAEPSATRLLSCGASSQFGFRRKTGFLNFRLSLKLSSLINLIVHCLLAARTVGYLSVVF